MIRRREDFKEAIDDFDREEYDKAIEIFEHLVEENPNDPDAKYNLALCYMRKIGIDKQKDEWFIPEDKSDEEVYAIRAISELNAILEKKPDDEEVQKMIKGIKKVMDME